MSIVHHDWQVVLTSWVFLENLQFVQITWIYLEVVCSDILDSFGSWQIVLIIWIILEMERSFWPPECFWKPTDCTDILGMSVNQLNCFNMLISSGIRQIVQTFLRLQEIYKISRHFGQFWRWTNYSDIIGSLEIQAFLLSLFTFFSIVLWPSWTHFIWVVDWFSPY